MNFAKKKICCNPFKKLQHKPSDSSLKVVTEDIISKANSKYGMKWITTKMHMCMGCRMKITSTSTAIQQQEVIWTEIDFTTSTGTQEAGAIPSTSKEIFPVPQTSNANAATPSSDSSTPITSPSTAGSVASIIVDATQLENYEKLQKIADILDIKIPPFPRLDPSSSNFRISTETETLNSLQKGFEIALSF